MTPNPNTPRVADQALYDLQPESIFEHVEWLRGLALRLARDEASADDLVQRTAVVALRRGHELPKASRRRVRGWLSRILLNEARNEWRSSSRRRDYESRAAAEMPNLVNPADQDERLELARTVLEAVNKLDEPYRSTILARYFDHSSTRDIAERNGLPLRTVETRLTRGRDRLRSYLSEYAPRGGAWATLVLPSWKIKAAPATTRWAGWKVPLAAVGAAAIATMGLALTWGEEVGSAPRAGLEPATASAAQPAELAQVEESAPERVEIAALGPASLDPTTPSTAASHDLPHAFLHGRVETLDGEPIEGAAVYIYSFAAWGDGIDAQELAMNDVPLISTPSVPWGFTAETNAEGRFELEVPLHPTGFVLCVVDAGPFYERWKAHFSNREGARPSLLEGDRGLPTITLGAAGAVEGRVVDADGEPIAMARITPGPNPGSTFRIEKYTDANGHFLVGHAREGALNINVTAAGFQLNNLEEVEVQLGQTTEIPDIVLEISPLISGIVRTPDGSPLEGVEVGGWPKIDGSGRHARAITDPQGRFEIALPQLAPYALAATKAGYETWGTERSFTTTFEPGTTDLEITLRPVEPIEILVVDGQTGEPAEEFGFCLLPSSGEDGDRPIMLPKDAPPVKARPGGTISVPGRDGVDAYAIYVDGQLPFTGTLWLEGEEPPHITIRLEIRPTLRGRFVRDGEPIAGASVFATPGATSKAYYAAGVPGETEQEKQAREEMLKVRSLRRFKPEQLQEIHGTTDEHGAFELTGLKSVVHSLRLTDGNALSTLVYPVDLATGSQDLGVIEAEDRGSIEGRLIVPVGIDATGLKIVLNSMDRTSYAVADVNGHFTFLDVDPGLHEVQCEGRDGELARSLAMSVEVPAGGAGSIEMDLLASAFTPARVLLRLHGAPLSGASVRAHNAETVAFFGPGLGLTDEQGFAEGLVTGSGFLRLYVAIGGTQLPNEALPLIPYVAGVPVDAVVELEVAELSVTLPPSVSLPSEGQIDVLLHSEDGPFSLAHYRIEISAGQLSGTSPHVASLEGRTLTLGLLPQVSTQVTLDVTSSASGEPALRPFLGMAIHSERWPSVFETVFNMDCSAGTCAPVELGH